MVSLYCNSWPAVGFLNSRLLDQKVVTSSCSAEAGMALLTKPMFQSGGSFSGSSYFTNPDFQGWSRSQTGNSLMVVGQSCITL